MSRSRYLLSASVLVLLSTAGVDANPLPPAISKCDVNGSGTTDVVDVQAILNQALGLAPAVDVSGDGWVNVLDVQFVANAALNLGCAADSASRPTISDFNPKTGPVGTLVTVTGGNFGAAPVITMPSQGGGGIVLPVSENSAASLMLVIPEGAVSGAITINNGSSGASTPSAFTVTPSSTFSLTAAPGTASLIQGHAVSYAVKLASADGFGGLAKLSVSGVPAGITASVTPASLTTGQTSVVTLTAPANQAIANVNLSISASATVDDLPEVQSVGVGLAVVAPTTTLLGRTVVSDPLETPLAGVTVSTLGLDGNGNSTNCTGFTAISDAAGNFALSNLPLACSGPQLIGFDGTTATSPAGHYAGVNLVFTLSAGQVTASPVLVHLPRIDNVETFFVTQNAGTDQTHAFTSIPGLSVTVYAGTTFSMPDGSKPNPFPLAGVEVPVDRLPDAKPNVPTMARVFIVAFQPANATATQPVAVTYPNVSNTPPGTDMVVMTLDPTHGTMVPYGTCFISPDGTQCIPDLDPMHSGHRFGLVHFDWHGLMPPGPFPTDPGPDGPGNTASGGPGSPDGSGGAGADGGGNGPNDPDDPDNPNKPDDPNSPGNPDGPGNPNSPNSPNSPNNPNDPPGSPDGSGSGGGGSGGPSGGGPFGGGPFGGGPFGGGVGTSGGGSGLPVQGCSGQGTAGGGGGRGKRCGQGGPVTGGEPIDLSSGIHVLIATDMAVRGARGSIYIQRIYRTMSTAPGPFGIGSQMNYGGWYLDAATPATAQAINLVAPDGSRFLFSRQTDGTLRNTTVPSLVGAVMTTAAASVTVQSPDGTSSVFQATAGLYALTSVTDRFGNTTTFTEKLFAPVVRISQITDPVGRSLTLTYDANAHVTSVTDPLGRTVNYTYNASGTLATVTDAAGKVTSYSYDGQNRLVSMTDPRGVVMFQDVYDANGRVVQQTLPDGGVVNFAYTLANPLIASSPVIATVYTDALGNQTTYRFNVRGFVTDVTDALGQTKSFIRDPGTNQVLKITGGAQCGVCGPSGRGDVTYTYDAQGNVLTKTDALGNTTTYTYDPVFNQVTSVTDALHHTRTFTYDSAGNLTRVTDKNGHATSFTYDAHGVATSVTDAQSNKTTFTYDTLENPVGITDALGNTTTNTFDVASRLVTRTDAMGRTSANSYDPLDRLISNVDGQGNSTQYAYDGVGNLLQVTDANNHATTYTYDSLGRMNKHTDGLGRSDSYQYDKAGNVTQFTDRRGQTSTFQYDALNRLVGETYSDATVARTYDAYSRLAAVNDSAGGAFGFSYDAAGSLIAQKEPTGLVTYTRDALGRVATRQVAGQALVSYTYDPAGNLLSAGMTGASVTNTYDARNLPLTSTRTNGVASTYSFDALGRMLTLTHSKGATALNSQTYQYDATGDRIGASSDLGQALATQSAASTVDAANQLLTGGQTAYTNDPNGNRLSEAAQTTSLTYVWDGRNRLASITDKNGNRTTFQYDFARNLMAITRPGNARQSFVVDGLTNVVSLTDSSGLPVSVLTGNTVDSHVGSVSSDGSAIFGIDDSLGSTVATTDANGNLAATLHYEPFGQTAGSGPASYPFGFTGRIPVVGNILYFRHRFYDTGTGRFLSEDPLGVAGGDTNLYRYRRDSPLNATDPSGEGGPGRLIFKEPLLRVTPLVTCLCQDVLYISVGGKLIAVPIGKPHICK